MRREGTARNTPAASKDAWSANRFRERIICRLAGGEKLQGRKDYYTQTTILKPLYFFVANWISLAKLNSLSSIVRDDDYDHRYS